MELRVSHLYKSYGEKSVLRDLSFTAGVGVTCLTAPSGGGKTTLLRILLGLEQPDRGAVSVPEGLRWAAVFQEDRLLPGKDAMGNLRFALGGALDVRRAEDMLARLGLSDLAGKPVRDYSGGMKRRLALARALLADADALALDEPFTGLDPDSRERALTAIGEAAQRKIVLLVSHEASDAAALHAAVVPL